MKKNLPIWKRLTIVALLSVFTYSLIGCSKDEDEGIHVLTYNMKFESEAGGGDPVYTWERRLPGIVKSFEDYNADIVGSQELRKWQLDELMSDLSDKYAYVGEPRYLEDDEHSVIIYNQERFEYLEGDTIWLSETPEIVGSKSWDTSLPRIVTYGKFIDTLTDIELYVFNTHLDHRSELARKNGLALIVDLMLEFEDYPIILTGDFNMNLDSENFVALTERSDLYNDTFSPFEDQFDPNGLTSHGFMGGIEGKAIDFIFYTTSSFTLEKTIIVRDKWEDRFFLSDHYPVYSKLYFIDN